MSERVQLNDGEIGAYIDLVRQAQYPGGAYLEATRLEHIKVLALLSIAQDMSILREVGGRTIVSTDGNFNVQKIFS